MTIYIGPNRGAPIPATKAEVHNSDVAVTITTVGGIKTCRSSVIVRNNGTSDKRTVRMTWSENTSGPILTVCSTSTGDNVELPNLPIPSGATPRTSFLPFVVHPRAKALIVVAAPNAGVARDFDPGCGVRSI